MASSPYDWIDLVPYWAELERLAWGRHSQKRAFRSSNLWTKRENSHFYGLCGEAVVAQRTGLRIDRELRIEGDPGYDFRIGDLTIDVKTATYWRSPDLKEFPDKSAWPGAYVLVALDVERKRGRVAGWFTAGRVKRAALRDYGHGPMLHIPGRGINAK